MATTKFDVGGYKLAAEISGEGTPTVVFSSGCGDTGEPWGTAIAALGSRTTLLTYSRAGVGESETPTDTSPRSVGAKADELHRLLTAADIKGPIILVGHSLGALVALAFAAQRPQDLAGLVLVDSTDIYLNLDKARPTLVIDDGDRDDCLSFDVPASAVEITRARRLLGVPATVIASRVGSWLDVEDPEPWLPYTLEAMDERWQLHHQSLAADLGATHKNARYGGHYIQKDDPTIVANSIDDLVNAARDHLTGS